MGDVASMVPFTSQLALTVGASVVLHPLAVVAHRWSLHKPPLFRPSKSLKDLAQQAKEIYRHDKIFRHPAVWTITGGTSSLAEAIAYACGLGVGGILSGFVDVFEDEVPRADWDSLDPSPSRWCQGGILGLAINAASALIASIPTRFVTLARVRLNAQVPLAGGSYKYTGVFQCLRTIKREEGLWGPYLLGFVPCAISLLVQDVVSSIWTAYRDRPFRLIRRRFPTDDASAIALQHAFCAALESTACYFLGWLFSRPFETILRCLDVQGSGLEAALGIVDKYDNWIHCAKQIIQLDGIRGFYAGGLPELLPLVPFFAGTFLLDLLFIRYELFRVRTVFDDKEADDNDEGSY